MDRATFSPFWHRVATTRPRLRPHVQVTRQHYRRGRWHIAHDPASNHFYRLNPVAHDFVALLDGGRSVDEAWQLSLTRHGDAAPTQNEIIELLSQLYSSNLLAIDASPETRQLLQRGKERAAARAKQQLIGLMSLRIKIFNPDAVLSWLEPIFRPVLSRAGLIGFAVLFIWALASVLPHARRVAQGFDDVTNPANWGWIFVTFVILKAWHELGHGLICKRFGGQVPEFGILLLVLFPSPYVDASSAWAFDNKWKRVLVGCGGMLFELTAASVAALIYVGAADGTLLKQVCSYVMISSSISTVFFNANPLMRFDGYFIFSDLVEVPNLMNRSMSMLKFLFQRHIYRIETARPPTSSASEAVILLLFGIASLIYRVLLFVAITFLILQSYAVIGVLLAAWSVAVWFALPIGGFAQWLSTSGQLADRRGRALLTSLIMGVAAALLVGVAPIPDWRRATGVIEPVHRAGVYVTSEGFVAACHKRPGERVSAGEPILTLNSPDLAAQIRVAEANLRVQETTAVEARAKNDPSSADIAVGQARVWRESLTELRKRTGDLVVRAPIEGVVVGTDPARLLGAFVAVSAPVCEVVGTDAKRIVAVLDQEQASWMFELPPADVHIALRPASAPGVTIEATGAVALPAGQTELPHAALGIIGGGQATVRRDDPSGRALDHQKFVVRIEAAPQDLASFASGQRVHIRATLPSKPLLQQVVDRLGKALQGRVSL
ncbi:hemolysin D [soil metagenome]